MEEFVRSYGAWILLGLVFVAMHWFGRGCGAGHRHGGQAEDRPDRPGGEEDPVARSGRRRGCH